MKTKEKQERIILIMRRGFLKKTEAAAKSQGINRLAFIREAVAERIKKIIGGQNGN